MHWRTYYPERACVCISKYRFSLLTSSLVLYVSFVCLNNCFPITTTHNPTRPHIFVPLFLEKYFLYSITPAPAYTSTNACCCFDDMCVCARRSAHAPAPLPPHTHTWNWLINCSFFDDFKNRKNHAAVLVLVCSKFFLSFLYLHHRSAAVLRIIVARRVITTRTHATAAVVVVWCDPSSFCLSLSRYLDLYTELLAQSWLNWWTRAWWAYDYR